ncbi:ComF family protein [Hydrogenophaga sp.]|uniref:ComF family protein n=1 Tax=Hydrogenophaga sp. TaxID=1904254 RepID=UPI00198A5E2D|nr:ComF family protein [Hydrogenophaga sp.]MBD3893453.1 ComF family protein [Hydrogenophaga sp.]
MPPLPLAPLWKRLSSAVPSSCQICGRWPAQAICPACEQRFGAPRPRCRTCALALADAPAFAALDQCGACLTPTDPLPLHACVAAVDYAYPWDALIARFKFQGEAGWAVPMAALLLQQPPAQQLLAQANLLVPVPLTPARLAQRGYNQAWELVKAIRRSAGPRAAAAQPVADALLRVGQTADQHQLPRAQRLRNLQQAFIAHPQRLDRLHAAHVLLVDDVVTTGATLHSAAQALRQGGAERVSALVFARTP